MRLLCEGKKTVCEIWMSFLPSKMEIFFISKYLPSVVNAVLGQSPLIYEMLNFNWAVAMKIE